MEIKQVVITFPLSLGVPGGGTVGCMQIARHLKRLGVGVDLLSVQARVAYGPAEGRRIQDESLGQSEENSLRDEGIEAHRVQPHPLHFSLDGMNVFASFRSLQKHRAIQAVISFHHELFHSYPYFKEKKIRSAMVTAAPGYQVFSGKSLSTREVRKFVLQSCLRESDVIFPPSNFIRESILQVRGVAPEKVVLAPWGISDRFLDCRPGSRPDDRGPDEHGSDDQESDDPFRIFFFGWWVKEKGIFDLLQALRPLAGQNWRLSIAGWGSEEDLRRSIAENGLGEQAEILGKLSHFDLTERLSASNLVALPSYAESFGLAVAEAQACGCPVLAYRAGGVPEIVLDGETGWLVSVGDIPGLTDRIAAALADPAAAAALGRRGRERVLSVFSWRQTAEIILQELA